MPRTLLLVVMLAAVAVAWSFVRAQEAVSTGAGDAELAPGEHLELDDRLSDLRIHHGRDGDSIEVHTSAGTRRFTPEQFARVIERELEYQRSHGPIFVIFNITSWWGVAWVVLGLAGQLMFSLRMILQWIASERAKTSVVPVSFWWISLTGATMLILYFVWRKDLVGVIGQSTGWFIYLRNLWLMKPARRPVAADPTGHPEVRR